MQYEQWLKAIICAVSEEYKISDRKAKNIFERILNRLKGS